MKSKVIRIILAMSVLLVVLSACGETGAAGKTAYELAHENGFDGTFDEWLASLVGKNGDDGKSAYELAVENGYDGTLDEWLKSFVPAENGKTADKISVSAGSLAAGEKMKLDVPETNTGLSIVFNATVGEMGNITIIRGDKMYGGKKIVITATSVEDYNYTTEWVLDKTYEHGLEIGDRLSVVITNEKFGGGGRRNTTVSIVSLGGTYKFKNIHMFGGFSDLRAECVSGSFTDCELSFFSSEWTRDIWVFGDSYQSGISEKLFDLGYTDFMSDSRSGRSSAGALESLEKLLKYHTPEKIIWLMGMNDGDSETEINASWKNCAEKLKTICEENGIELIFATIPNVTVKNHTFKNEYIRSSGYRYIDNCMAVGADFSTTWYDGLKREGNDVHPSVTGFGVIAAEIAGSVPELK